MCHECRDAVAVRRELGDGVSSVVLRDQFHPLGTAIAKTALAEVSADRMGERGYLLHPLAAVIAFAVRREAQW